MLKDSSAEYYQKKKEKETENKRLYGHEKYENLPEDDKCWLSKEKNTIKYRKSK